MTTCRILMTPLKSERERALGYSTKGLKTLTGLTQVVPQLAFTREQFVKDLPKAQQGMSISGYQPKLQMVLEDGAFAVVESKGNYILKPSPVDFPQLAENEHATMTVMARLGFDVPPQGLLPFKPENDGDALEYAFVIRRFDRDEQGEAIHQEQLDGAMDIGEKYGKIADDGKPWVSYEQVALFLRQNVNDNVAFISDLFRRIIYAYLLGNNDLHLRNFGLLLPLVGSPRLSPVYDYVSVAPYPQYVTRYLALALALPLLVCEEGEKDVAAGFNTQYGEYLGMDFLALGQSMGLSEKLAGALLNALLKEQAVVESTYRDSFMQPDAVEAVLRCYRQRLSRLQILDEPPLG